MKMKMLPILLSLPMVLWLPFEVIGIKSTAYTGTVNTTIFGKPCQYWKLDKPHDHTYNSLPENYCRDPTSSNYLWCYTTDPKVRWDICDPRVLTEIPPYKSVLSNTTGPYCKNTVCCNVTWQSFRDVHSKCDPTMFVKLRIFYRQQKDATDMVYFVKKYMLTKYFTSIPDTNVRSQLDCASKCLIKSESECNGFINSENKTNHKRCFMGKFNSPEAIKTLSDV